MPGVQHSIWIDLGHKWFFHGILLDQNKKMKPLWTWPNPPQQKKSPKIRFKIKSRKVAEVEEVEVKDVVVLVVTVLVIVFVHEVVVRVVVVTVLVVSVPVVDVDTDVVTFEAIFFGVDQQEL